MMEKKIRTLCLAALCSLVFTGMAFAQSTIKYIQFTFAPYNAQSPGVTFPVFIYSELNNGQWKQVGYVPDETKSIYVGPIKSKQKLLFKIATAQLNQKQTAVKAWTSGCEIAVQQFKITYNTCVTSAGDPIATLNKTDAKNGANFANLSFASNEPLPALSVDAQPTPYYFPAYKKNRTITFYNLTHYSEIGLSDTRFGPNYPTYVLSPRQKYTYTLPANQSRASLGWVVSGYSKQAGCQPGESCWIYSGGYFNSKKNETAYATKVESTIHSAKKNNYGLNAVANATIDLSAVDGFNFKMILVPTQLTYCTKNPPSQWTNPNSVPFVSRFSPENPLAQIPNSIKKHHAILYPKIQDICNKISSAHFITRDLEPGAYIANLFVNNASDKFMGCMSPCAYATQQVDENNKAFIQAFSASGNGNNIINKFCCTKYSPYSTKATCDAAGFVNQTAYVRMLDGSDGVIAHPSQAKFKNTYAYQFDDPNANIGCPGDTHFAVYIFNGTSAPKIQYLTAPNNIWVNPGKTSVEFGWSAPLDSQKNAIINYEAVLMQNNTPIKNGFCDRASPEHACYFPGGTLKENTTYELKITAFDGKDSLSSKSKLIHFTTRGGKINAFTAAPSITSITQDGVQALVVNWTASLDARNPVHTPISYVVTVTEPGVSTPIAQQTIQNPAQLGTVISGIGLLYADFTVSVQAQDTVIHNGDAVKHDSAIATQNFDAGTIVPAQITMPFANITATSATVNWTAARDHHFNPKAVMDYHVLVTPNAQGGKTSTYDAAGALSYSLTGLQPNTTYNVQISASDSVNGIAAISTPAQFSTTKNTVYEFFSNHL